MLVATSGLGYALVVLLDPALGRPATRVELAIVVLVALRLAASGVAEGVRASAGAPPGRSEPSAAQEAVARPPRLAELERLVGGRVLVAEEKGRLASRLRWIAEGLGSPEGRGAAEGSVTHERFPLLLAELDSSGASDGERRSERARARAHRLGILGQLVACMESDLADAAPGVGDLSGARGGQP